MYQVGNLSIYFYAALFFAVFSSVSAGNCTFKGWNNDLADPTNCCVIPKFKKNYEHPNINVCFRMENSTECDTMKCIFKEQNFTSINGSFNMDEISKYILEGKSADWRPAVKESLKICFRIAEGKPCPEVAFADCVFDALFVNCPTGNWHESEKCEHTKQFVKECLLSL